VLPALALAVAAVICLVALIWPPAQLPRHNLLLLIAVIPQLGTLSGWHSLALLGITTSAAVLWCLSNRSLAGSAIIAVGLITNALPMAAYGGRMPIHERTLSQLGIVAAPGTVLTESKDIVTASQSPMMWLADWILLPTPLGMIAASPGDLVLVLGIFWWVWTSTQEALHAQRPARDPAKLSASKAR
jgi:Family of unknown function (DUF5317)